MQQDNQNIPKLFYRIIVGYIIVGSEEFMCHSIQMIFLLSNSSSIAHVQCHLALLPIKMDLEPVASWKRYEWKRFLYCSLMVLPFSRKPVIFYMIPWEVSEHWGYNLPSWWNVFRFFALVTALYNPFLWLFFSLRNVIINPSFVHYDKSFARNRFC